MAGGKFMAYLAQAHAIAKGRGRVTWGVDLSVFDPKKTNQEQRADTWLAAFTPEVPAAADHVLFERSHDGTEALRLLVVAMAKKYGLPPPRVPN